MSDSVVKYNDLIDFSDDSEMNAAIEKIDSLIDIYEKLVKSATDGKKRVKQESDSLVKTIEEQIATIKGLNITLESAQKEFDKLKFAMLDNKDIVSKLSKEEKAYEIRIRELSEQVRKLREGKKSFIQVAKETSEQFKANNKELKDLNKAYEESKKKTDALEKVIDGKLNPAYTKSKRETNALKKEINSLSGTFKEAKAPIMAQVGSIEALKQEYKAAKTAMESIPKTINGELNPAYEKAKKGVAGLKNAINENNREQREAARLASVQEGSLEEMRGELRKLNKEFDNLSKEEREATKTGKALLSNIQKLDQEIKDLEESTGRSQRSVGDYGKALEGLRGVASSIGGGGILGNVLGGLAAGGAAGVGMALLEGAGEALGAIIETSKEINVQLRQTEVLFQRSFTSNEIDSTLAGLRSLSEEFPELEVLSEGFDSSAQAMKKLVEDFGDTPTEAMENYTFAAIQAQEHAGQMTTALNEQGSAFNKLGFSSKESLSLLSRSAQLGITQAEDLSDAVNEFNVAFQRQEFTKELQAAFGADFANKIFTEFEGNGKGALEAISKKIVETGNDSKEVGDLMSKAFKSFGEEKDIENLIGVFSNLSSANDDLTSSLTDRQKKQLELVKSNSAVQAKLIELTKEFEGSGAGLQVFGNKVKELGLELLIDLIQGAKNAFSFLQELVQPLSDQFSGLGDNFSRFLDFISSANEAINNIRIGFLSTLLESARNNFGDLILIGKEFQPVFDKVSEVIGEVVDFLQDLISDASSFDEFFDSLADNFGFVGEAARFLGQGIKAAFDTFIEFMTGGFITGGLKRIIAIFSAVGAAFDAFKNNLADFSVAFDDLLNFDFEKAKNRFKASFEDIGNVAVSAYEAKVKDLTFVPEEVPKKDVDSVEKSAEELGKKYVKKFKSTVKKEVESTPTPPIKVIPEIEGFDDAVKKVEASILAIDELPKPKPIKIELDAEDVLKEGEGLNNFIDFFGEKISNTIDFSKELVSGIADFTNTIFENQNQKTQEEVDKNNEQRELQIEAAGGDQDRIAKINETFDRKQQKLENEQQKRKIKQARLEKAVRIASIVGDTAQAIIKALTLTPAPLGIPFAIQAGALGAIQLATAVATKIPSFEKGRGGEYLPETLAVVNESGRELSVDKNGNLAYMNSSIRAKGDNGKWGDLVNLDQGTRVLTHEQTLAVENGANVQYTHSVVETRINEDRITEPIIKALDSMNVSNTTLTEKGLLYSTKRGTRTVNWANKRNGFGRGDE